MPDPITKRWLPGESGNPRGRPHGALSKTPTRRMLDDNEPELVAKAITMALDGDVTALKLCLERLEPPRRRPRTVAHPEVEALLDGSADLDAIGLAVMKAVHRNELDPDDAYATVEMLLARKRLAAKSAEPLPEFDGDQAAKLRQLAALVGYEVVPKANGSGNGASS